MRYAVLIFASVALAAVAAALTIWDRFTVALTVPAGTSAVPVVFEVHPGEALEDLVPRLADRGLIGDRNVAERYLASFHDPHRLTPGEYALSPSMGIAEVVAHLESGRRVEQPVNIPEGATVEQAARLFAQAGIVTAEAFLAAARDPALIEQLGLPRAGLEGFILPEVYTFPRGTPARAVIAAVVAAFQGTFNQVVGDRTNGLSRNEVVTLASLIESTPMPRAERRQLSALMRNRVRARIPLHVAAARRYANERYGAAAFRWDTFSQTGWPPGPICSPGIGALLAAANPATSRALYAVARGDGSHVFCDDLDCLYEESRRYKQRIPRPLPLPVRGGGRLASPPDPDGSAPIGAAAPPPNPASPSSPRPTAEDASDRGGAADGSNPTAGEGLDRAPRDGRSPPDRVPRAPAERNPEPTSADPVFAPGGGPDRGSADPSTPNRSPPDNSPSDRSPPSRAPADGPPPDGSLTEEAPL